MQQKVHGFTLVEMMVTVALVGILALAIYPLAKMQHVHSKEKELKTALRQIRTALDAYKDAADKGHIYKSADSSGYPPALETLVEGVPDLRNTQGRKIFFLRRLPRDPFNEDHSLTAAATWGKRSYASEADDPKEGDDVYDVYSLSDLTGSNGVPYRTW